MVQQLAPFTAGFWDEENQRFVLINPVFIGNLDSAEGIGDFIIGSQYFNLSGVSQLQSGEGKAFLTIDDDLDSSITGASSYILSGDLSGYKMPFRGSVRNISMQLNNLFGSGDTTVALYKNNSNTSKTITIDCSSTGSRGNFSSIAAETFEKGDYLTLAITHSEPSLRTSNHNGLIYFSYSESS
jgi:hypothetical protein